MRGRSAATSLDGTEHSSKIEGRDRLGYAATDGHATAILLQHRTTLRNGQDDNDDAGVSDPRETGWGHQRSDCWGSLTPSLIEC